MKQHTIISLEETGSQKLTEMSNKRKHLCDQSQTKIAH